MARNTKNIYELLSENSETFVDDFGQFLLILNKIRHVY